MVEWILLVLVPCHGLVVVIGGRMESFLFQVCGLIEGCIGLGMTAIKSVVVSAVEFP